MRRWVVRGLVALGVIGLVLAGVVPHHHDGAAAHTEQACRVCRLQQSIAAAPELPAAVIDRPVAIGLVALPPADAPRVVQCVSSVSPRSPPVLS